MRIVHIYGLVDPRNNKIRYVGKTVKSLSHRLKQHLTSSVTNTRKTHKDNWILNLASDNLTPQSILLEECTEDNWAEAEIKWIASFPKDQLTNLSVGGDGPSGAIRSPEHIEAVRRSRLGAINSEESNEARRKWGIENSDRLIAGKVKTYDITFPDGHTETITNLSKFAREHGLSQGNLSSVVYGRVTQHKGYKVKIHGSVESF